MMGLDLERVKGVGPRQPNPTSTLWPYDASDHCPGTCRRVVPGNHFDSGNWYFDLACLDAWGRAIALTDHSRHTLALESYPGDECVSEHRQIRPVHVGEGIRTKYGLALSIAN